MHQHQVYDTDNHFVIDPITKEIINQGEKMKLMLGDHNSERFTFEIPRYIDGHDMTLCDKIEIHYINIDSKTKESNKDVYIVDDMQLSPNGEDVVIFSWLISGNATQLAGTLNFRATFKCISEPSIIDYQMSTEIFKGITVSDGISNSESVVEEYSDVLEQWKQELNLAGEYAQQIEQNASEIDELIKKVEANAKLTDDAVNELKGDLSQLSEENAELKNAMTLIQSENLFDESKQTKGYQYYSDGTIHENSIMAISDFIEVDKNRELFFGRRYPGDGVGKATVTNVIEFDENKKYVKGTERVTNIIPDDRTKYIRFSRNLNDQSYGIMLTYDNYATTFVEYEHYYVCIDKEAKKNSTNWYNVNYFGVLESNSAEDNFVALMALLTDVSDSGGGVIYIPRGKYNLKNSGNENYNFNNIEIIGDGIATVLIRWDRFPIFNICGESVEANGKHCKNITFRDIYFNSSQSYTDTMKPIMIFECVSCLRIESCIFNGNGSHLELRETFDSKIISTDFTNSGRRWKSSDVDDATFDVNNVIYNDLQNVSPTVIFASNGAESYNSAIESTNQILFWGCRFESFTDGVIGVIGIGANGIRFTDCKFESIYSTVPFLMICGSFVASSFENCYFYRPTILFARDDKKVVDTVPILFFNNNPDISRNKITGILSLYYNEEDMQKMKVPLIMCGQKTFKNIIELFFTPTNNNGDKYLEEDVNVVSDTYSQNIVNII